MNITSGTEKHLVLYIMLTCKNSEYSRITFASKIKSLIFYLSF